MATRLTTYTEATVDNGPRLNGIYIRQTLMETTSSPPRPGLQNSDVGYRVDWDLTMVDWFRFYHRTSS